MMLPDPSKRCSMSQLLRHPRVAAILQRRRRRGFILGPLVAVVNFVAALMMHLILLGRRYWVVLSHLFFGRPTPKRRRPDGGGRHKARGSDGSASPLPPSKFLISNEADDHDARAVSPVFSSDGGEGPAGEAVTPVGAGGLRDSVSRPEPTRLERRSTDAKMKLTFESDDDDTTQLQYHKPTSPRATTKRWAKGGNAQVGPRSIEVSRSSKRSGSSKKK